jgi:hypothetical protein
MVAADIAALLLVVGLLGLGGKSLLSSLEMFKGKRERREKDDEQMRQDLRAALQSKDYRKLDDFLVLWGTRADTQMRKHVQVRRDEMYIETEK